MSTARAQGAQAGQRSVLRLYENGAQFGGFRFELGLHGVFPSFYSSVTGVTILKGFPQLFL